MPSFNGVAIFGPSPTIVTGTPTRERQYNGFFGLNGTESLDGGFRNAVTSVKGLHRAIDLNGLIYTQAIFRSYYDELAYVLVDTLGRVWPNVQCSGFNPQGEVKIGDDGYVYQMYTAEFIHLTLAGT